MKGCGTNVIKYILFVFNLFFALSGLGIIIAGSIVLSEISDFDQFISSDIIGPPTVLIVTGAIVFIIAFLGCFGAIRESYKLLMAFGFLLILVFILELAAGITAAVYKTKFQETVRGSLKKSMKKYSEQNSHEHVSWDNVQRKMMCCGVDGPNDWPEQSTPSSCCTNDKLEQNTEAFCLDNAFGTYLFKTGCYDKLKMKIESNVKVLIGVGIGIAFIEVVGIILACWLAITIKNEENEK